ncbi:PG0541 family transporter-associated protein [Melioribacter sp. OK-6-Me]|uniref:PG0541 family transporter-associated protein n=1 Tax=unclassified Melioribacter TaxID=2627329 RepID=UPI003ED9B369
MKAVMIVYNHGITEEVDESLEKLSIRGFTRFINVHGQGSDKGEPHLGTHIWPSQNAVVLTVIEDSKVEPLLEEVKKINKEAEEQGIHAFVWNIEKMV